MSQLLAISFDVSSSPSISLRGAEENGASPVGTGWGFAWYPGESAAAAVMRDPRPVRTTSLTQMLSDWDHFQSTLFLCHVRGTTWRPTEADTQPFTRDYGGRTFSMIHDGQLDSVGLRELSLGDDPVFEPVGSTDSERAFCWLLTQIRGAGARRLADVEFDQLHQWLAVLNRLGTLNVILADGQSVFAYSDVNGFGPLSFSRITPPHAITNLSNQVLEVDIGDPLDVNRTLVMVANAPLSPGWSSLLPGQLLHIRRGAVEQLSGQQPAFPTTNFSAPPPGTAAPAVQSFVSQPSFSPPAANGSQTASLSTMGAPIRSVGAPMRRYRILHRTVFEYDRQVELSAHTIRLYPQHGHDQTVIEHSVDLSVPTALDAFEDVFGNRSLRGRIAEPYQRLEVSARSIIDVFAPHTPQASENTTLPLVWMPWQRQMMTPFLLPPELPETQLQELSDFGLSFAERQDHDVLRTLRDLNQSIRRDFDYVQGVTSNETTPFEVYASRRGVCQDFANLFICVARLLGIPARYRVGYIHTGASYENQLQSEASHAWAEVYLPWSGWRGFDPTNGCDVGLDHICVASGRNYRDATPTSGTLFKGGGNEQMSVVVEVEILEEKQAFEP